MGTQILTDCTLWLNQYDVTANVTELGGNIEKAEIESTTFGSPVDANGKKCRERKAGIEDSRLDLMTFWDPALIEGVAMPLVGSSNNVLAATVGGAQGDVCYFNRGELLAVKPGWPIGQMAKFDTGVASSSAEGVVRGKLITPKATRTATGNGTATLVKAVAAGQKVYGLAQVFTVTGATPSMTLKIQSDDNIGFTTPTDRLTFTAFTTAGFEMQSLAGAITDTYWRAVWTISGTSPNFTFGVCLGIR